MVKIQSSILVLTIPIFELPRVENCMSPWCPGPLPRSKHPNRVKTTNKRALNMLYIGYLIIVKG